MIQFKRLGLVLVWLAVSAGPPALSQQPVEPILTEEQRSWLDEHPKIRLAPTPHYPPTEWFNDSGEYVGISADFVSKIENRLGIEFEVVQTEAWSENLRMMQQREVDVFPVAAETPDRLEYARFTEPYINFPAVILVLRRRRGARHGGPSRRAGRGGGWLRRP